MIQENLGSRAQVDFNKENRPLFGNDVSNQGNYEKNGVFGGNGFGYRSNGSNSMDNRYHSYNGSYFSQDERPLNNHSDLKSLRDFDNPNPAYEVLRYENLPDLNSNVKPQEVIEHTLGQFKSSDWMEQFKAINTLRILNKQYNSEVNDIFLNFWEHIEKALNDIKTALQMNILLFVQECFSHSQQGQISEEVITNVFPVLMRIIFNGKKFIRDHTKQTVQLIAEKFPCNALFQSLGGILNHHSMTTEQAFICISILLHIITKLGQNIQYASEDSLGYIFVCIAKAQTQKYGKKAYDDSAVIASQMYSMMGASNYQQFIDKLFEHSKINEAGKRNLEEAIVHSEKANKPRFSCLPKDERNKMKSQSISSRNFRDQEIVEVKVD